MSTSMVHVLYILKIPPENMFLNHPTIPSSMPHVPTCGLSVARHEPPGRGGGHDLHAGAGDRRAVAVSAGGAGWGGESTSGAVKPNGLEHVGTRSFSAHVANNLWLELFKGLRSPSARIVVSSSLHKTWLLRSFVQ